LPYFRWNHRSNPEESTTLPKLHPDESEDGLMWNLRRQKDGEWYSLSNLQWQELRTSSRSHHAHAVRTLIRIDIKLSPLRSHDRIYIFTSPELNVPEPADATHFYSLETSPFDKNMWSQETENWRLGFLSSVMKRIRDAVGSAMRVCWNFFSSWLWGFFHGPTCCSNVFDPNVWYYFLF